MSETLEELLDEVRLLWHSMVQSGERLHKDEPITLGMRAVLEFLALRGPATVPHIARSRGVSRQHVQELVNALLDLDLVALGTNPSHRRSALIRPTSEGSKLIERMKRREQRFFRQLDLDVRPGEVRRAAQALRSVRKALGGQP